MSSFYMGIFVSFYQSNVTQIDLTRFTTLFVGKIPIYLDILVFLKMQLHKYQMQILDKLTYTPKARFTDLQNKGITSEHLTYHLNQLVELNLIEKIVGGYSLTYKGKDFVGSLDESTLEVEKNPKVSVLVYVCRTNDEGEDEYLMYKRLEQPYYGKIGSLTGKVKFGETFEEAAQREVKEETGLDVDLSLNHFYHKIRKDKDGTPVQDAVFAVFLATNPKGNLVQPKEAELFWATFDELKNSDDVFDDLIPNFKEMLKGDFRLVENVDQEAGY